MLHHPIKKPLVVLDVPAPPASDSRFKLNGEKKHPACEIRTYPAKQGQYSYAHKARRQANAGAGAGDGDATK